MFSIWNGKSIGQKEIKTWIDMGFQLIGVLLKAQIPQLQSHFLNFS